MQKQNSRILIIDDSADILELYTIILARENYQVLGKESGEDIEPIIQNFSPDVIILDMLLSGLDGVSVCRQLKKNPSTRWIPIIMVSALALARQKSVEAEADFFLEKPFDIKIFLSTISQGIELKKQRASLMNSNYINAKAERKK